MEDIIKKTTEKLKNGTITKEEADKFFLDSFNVIKRNRLSPYGIFCFGIISGIIITFTITLIII